MGSLVASGALVGGLKNAVPPLWLAVERTDRLPVLGLGVARNRIGHSTVFRLARRGVTYPVDVRRLVVFTIGIVPHKGSHLAAVLDEHEIYLEELRVRADLHQRERLLKFAAPYTPRVWAIEGARGLGALLAQQLVGSGETVLDVPAKLSARVRVLDNECADKNDSHDARSAAIVGIRNRRLVVVT